MADLIERESLNKWCHETMKAQTTVEEMSYIRTFWDAVNAVPNVDAVPVVRCKDCKHDGLFDCPICYIEKQILIFINHDPNFYCGYGERRTDNEVID